MATFKLIEISQAFNAFDDILDVRSPAEYTDDHIPGAMSVPVLNNEERARIGTLYTQVSPFEAKKLGAALIARNIAQHLEEKFSDRPKSWRPLVYCWRGGMRSGAMAHILAQVGWHTAQLAGGYKNYRRHVITSLETLPKQFDFRVISGGTGSGKSHLLHALAAQGAQVLDLEELAQHRGSLLGRLPNQPQPSQKTFETRLWDGLRTFAADRPVYIEAESRKVGVLSLPTMLVERMRASPCVRVEVPHEARVKFLMEDYAHFLNNPTLLIECLSLLVELHGHEVISRWCELAQKGEWELLVGELLTQHYDPAYKRSSGIGFPQLQQTEALKLSALDAGSLRQAAEHLIRNER
ncbi:MAG: tRNA 2-selenouridine(34) synthase MnmH [Pseudomonadota bacterium]